MSKIKIGVVGLGGIANIVHIPGLMSIENVEIAAICDIDSSKILSTKEKFSLNCKCFTDYKQMIEQCELSSVCICTPNDSHSKVAIKCIEKNIPFAIEKPVAASVSQLHSLKNAYINNPVPAMVCFSYRYKTSARKARDIISQGLLGKIRHVYVQYFQGWGSGGDTPYIWRFDKRKAGSGSLGDLGSHMIDLVRFMLGREYIRVLGHNGTFIKSRKDLNGKTSHAVKVDDFSHFFAELETDIVATFEITRFAYKRGNYQRVEIYGDNGGLVYNLDEDDSLSLCLNEDRYIDIKNEEMETVHKVLQMQQFINLVEGKQDGLDATVYDGIFVSEIMEKIILSAAKGKWVEI